MSPSNNGQIISEHWRRVGIERLLTSALDLRISGARVFPEQDPNRRPQRHVALFDRYVGALREVIPEAMHVWIAFGAQVQKTITDRDAALIEALRFQPAGAAFDARVVGVVRTYWLFCDQLNQETEEDNRVSPQVFMLQWLISSGYQEAVDVIAGMPYWPIGLDLAGNWV
jgi:hypothetical protein